MTRRFLHLMVFLLATGCAQQRAAAPNLALYCQVKDCICKPALLVFGKSKEPVPMLWRTNGEAYCPPDYQLTPTAKLKGFKRHYGG